MLKGIKLKEMFKGMALIKSRINRIADKKDFE
jgi:hypothetical protein